MNSFYSIVKVPTRPAGLEYINIGLLLINHQNFYFKISSKKLDVVKEVIPKGSFSLLKAYLNGISKNAKLKGNSLKLNEIEYINYLSDNNNNLITFVKAVPIELESNTITFQILFERFVFPY